MKQLQTTNVHCLYAYKTVTDHNCSLLMPMKKLQPQMFIAYAYEKLMGHKCSLLMPSKQLRTTIKCQLPMPMKKLWTKNVNS